MGPTGDARILQIHPTRKCNLQCLHCYSASGPSVRGELDLAVLCSAVTDARAEGYNVVGMSGGEPLLYGPLRELLLHARSEGFFTTVTSNGMLLDARRLKKLQGAVDLLAISLDGVAESHNRMRAHPQAFETMRSRLQGVRDSGLPFGFIFTLTQHNLHELDEVAQFALEQGARLLQIHPLEAAGRALLQLPESIPDEIESAFAFLEAGRIQELVGSTMRVQLDLVSQAALRSSPDKVFADGSRLHAGRLPLADLVSPLIIEADGQVVPLQYGFARQYALGSLRDASLCELGDRWQEAVYASFTALCKRAFDELEGETAAPIADWYETVGRLAEARPAHVMAPA